MQVLSAADAAAAGAVAAATASAATASAAGTAVLLRLVIAGTAAATVRENT